MDLAILLFTGFTLGITGAMIPGPLTFFTVSETLKTDRFAGLKTIAGHIAIEFIIVGLIFLGLNRFFDLQVFKSVVYIAGGAALIAMGGILIKNSGGMKLLKEEAEPRFNKGLFVGGVFFSIASPGFLVWWATIGVSTIIRALLFGIAGVAVLMAGHWMADALWYWFISYAVDKGKAYMTDGSYRRIVRVFSSFLILLGAYFLLLGL